MSLVTFDEHLQNINKKNPSLVKTILGEIMYEAWIDGVISVKELTFKGDPLNVKELREKAILMRKPRAEWTEKEKMKCHSFCSNVRESVAKDKRKIYLVDPDWKFPEIWRRQYRMCRVYMFRDDRSVEVYFWNSGGTPEIDITKIDLSNFYLELADFCHEHGYSTSPITWVKGSCNKKYRINSVL